MTKAVKTSAGTSSLAGKCKDRDRLGGSEGSGWLSFAHQEGTVRRKRGPGLARVGAGGAQHTLRGVGSKAWIQGQGICSASGSAQGPLQRAMPGQSNPRRVFLPQQDQPSSTRGWTIRGPEARLSPHSLGTHPPHHLLHHEQPEDLIGRY